ncbi:primosomal protein [Phenylobacterium sp.]|uniref:primosomal protein n=1 Tax=Phenylobacterium sp. TaxID=1871053 RepID=UPI0027346AA0|nr:primosomal protein [Phenylobacterium sp.]MDP3658912.1 primosomal protein [Phenylobacterium sp.]
MPGPETDEGFDDQDRAEVLDETNYDGGEGPGELRTFEDLVDVFDVTRADGDADEDEAVALDAADFDEEAIDDEDLEEDDDVTELLAADETDLTDDVDSFDEDALDDPDNIEGLDEVADADLVAGGEDRFTDFQSKGVGDADLQRMGYSDENGLAKDND